jgi:hypothetical protein
MFYHLSDSTEFQEGVKPKELNLFISGCLIHMIPNSVEAHIRLNWTAHKDFGKNNSAP